MQYFPRSRNPVNGLPRPTSLSPIGARLFERKLACDNKPRRCTISMDYIGINRKNTVCIVRIGQETLGSFFSVEGLLTVRTSWAHAYMLYKKAPTMRHSHGLCRHQPIFFLFFYSAHGTRDIGYCVAPSLLKGS